MMWLNKMMQKIKYKKLIIVLLLAFLFSTYSIQIVLGFFYLKNGNSMSVNTYKIEFPFLHWAYFGESKITNVLIGKNINSHKLSAEFFKSAEELNILDAISNCDSVKEQRYDNKSIKGNIYLCTKSEIETMYFQSDDKKILIRENDYSSSNEKVVEEYQLLLDSITHFTGSHAQRGSQ